MRAQSSKNVAECGFRRFLRFLTKLSTFGSRFFRSLNRREPGRSCRNVCFAISHALGMVGAREQASWGRNRPKTARNVDLVLGVLEIALLKIVWGPTAPSARAIGLARRFGDALVPRNHPFAAGEGLPWSWLRRNRQKKARNSARKKRQPHTMLVP